MGKEQELEQLITQMRESYEGAKQVVKVLGEKGWLADGSLNGADLYEADLNGATRRRQRRTYVLRQR